MDKLPDNAALIIIDVQVGFEDLRWGPRNNLWAEEQIATLLAAWRKSSRPIFHVQHLSQQPDSPLRPDHPGCKIKAVVAPQGDEPVLQKRVNNAFVGTDLEQRLREQNIDTVICVGLTTNHCVSTTARMAGDLGFETYVVEDATAAFELKGHDGLYYPADQVHTLALVNLNEEFATVTSTSEVLGRL